MSIASRVIAAIIGPVEELSPADLARKAINEAGYSETIRSQALARFNRRMWAGKGVPESLRAVMAWAESAS